MSVLLSCCRVSHLNTELSLASLAGYLALGIPVSIFRRAEIADRLPHLPDIYIGAVDQNSVQMLYSLRLALGSLLCMVIQTIMRTENISVADRVLK